MNFNYKLLTYILFLFFISSCAFLENHSGESSLQSLINTPPSKIELFYFNEKVDGAFEINQNGDFHYWRIDFLESDSVKTKFTKTYSKEQFESNLVRTKFTKTYSKEQFDKALTLAWNVVLNDYSNAVQDNKLPKQTIYQITFGELRNSTSFRILVEDNGHMPDSLRAFYHYMLSLAERSSTTGYKIREARSLSDHNAAVYMLICENGTIECDYKWDSSLCKIGMPHNTTMFGQDTGNKQGFIQTIESQPARLFICK